MYRMTDRFKYFAVLIYRMTDKINKTERGYK